MQNKKRDIIQLILTAVMIAMIFLAGNIIKVPTFGGFVHIGDCMVLISAVILGKRRGAIASAVGMTLVDIYGGYIIWAPFTFVIKGAMAYITGTILEKFKEHSVKVYLISFLTSGIFMIIGYFISGAVIANFLTGEVNGLISALAYSAKDILGNTIQVITGIIIAIPLSKVLEGASKKVFYT